MKVLMFGWEFPPHISGGLGTACHGLASRMVGLGVEILFVLPRLRSEVARQGPLQLIGANQVFLSHEEEISWNIKHEKFSLHAVDAAIFPYMTQKQYLQEQREMDERMGKKRTQSGLDLMELSGDYGSNLNLEVQRYALIAEHIARKESFDIIHAHDWMTFPAGVRAKHASGKPLVVHVHATDFDRSGDLPNPHVYGIEKWGMENADRIIAVSQRTKDLLVYRYHQDPARIDVVHNAVTKEKGLERHDVQKGVSEKIVLFLGRVTMQKGPDYFVEAAYKVLKQMKNVRFVMAGAGDMLPRIIERMAQLRMTNRFHFTGFLRGRQLEEMFAMSDLYVMPSVSEPFGITPFEAAKYGVPVIISKQSGITEVFKNAIKVDFWDIDKLARSMIDVLSKEGLSKSMVEGGFRELEKIDWVHSAGKVLETYYKTLDQKH